MVTGLYIGNSYAHLLDNANTFMTQYAPRLARGHIAFQDMQVSTTNRCLSDPDVASLESSISGIGRSSTDFLPAPP